LQEDEEDTNKIIISKDLNELVKCDTKRAGITVDGVTILLLRIRGVPNEYINAN